MFLIWCLYFIQLINWISIFILVVLITVFLTNLPSLIDKPDARVFWLGRPAFKSVIKNLHTKFSSHPFDRVGERNKWFFSLMMAQFKCISSLISFIIFLKISTKY